jgi:energy-coupling factor transporter ATP-binding protein EcfA2
VSDPYFLDSLTLAGFRAYLDPKTFEFGTKRCLAVFAPNGKGKSSIVDGLEFMFSADGSLVRLGGRAGNNNAGPAALAHNLAAKHSIDPSVKVRFKHGADRPDGARKASGTQRPRPAIADAVGACFVVDPIIRGHALRRFVEEQTADKRYEDVAGWLQLGALVDVQHNLRDLRKKVKATADDRAAVNQIDVQLGRKTANAVRQWDDTGVLAHANSLVAGVSDAISLVSLSTTDDGFLFVKQAAEAEEKQLGIEGLRQIRRAAALVADEQEDPENPEATFATGLVEQVSNAIAAQALAAENERTERGVAASAMFDDLWKSAEALFAADAEPLETCPVCATPITDTAAGSIASIRDHLATHRAELADYATARAALATANQTLARIHEQLKNALAALSPLLPNDEAALKTAVDAYLVAVEAWKAGSSPDATGVAPSVRALVKRLDKSIAAIAEKQGDNTYAKVLVKLQELIELGDDRRAGARKTAELEKLSASLVKQAQFISQEIRKKVQAVLDTLQDPVNAIYREIQRDGAAPVRLELPAETDATQHRLNLVVDFAENRPGVQPGGYLSDSQIHSLALALRLAAIKRCNVQAPIIVLDDVVTSYDADHRLAIAALLAKQFADFQIVITTHDERFFTYLKDHLGDQNWQYTRILRLDPDYGPHFADHHVSDAMIEARWTNGESAANDMRQAEDEWLVRICREFGVDVRIRTVERAYSYERSELAIALAGFLKSRGLQTPAVPGVNNRFLLSLQMGAVENFGSHFQDAEYGAGSQGDEKTRWQEFKFFRDKFVCPTCSKGRFKCPSNLSKPVCAHDGCEAQFSFVQTVGPNATAGGA